MSRPLRSLRLSVTDRCNLRCTYCMPEEVYAWLPRKDILDYEEIEALVAALGDHGPLRVRLTGGEPLLRRDLPDLVARLAALDAVEDLSLTTNATRLADAADRLHDAGLDRITVSLDTLRPDRFLALTRRDDLERVLVGLDAAAAAGFTGTKVNAVVQRGVNDDELGDLLAFAAERALELRFIEYMDVGGATRWTNEVVVSAREMLERIEALGRGPVAPLDPVRTAAPADRYRIGDGQTFGIIASTTRPFCGQCDRARLTADGRFITCLYGRDGHPIAPILRGRGARAAAAAIAAVWNVRTDRGAEARLEQEQRGALLTPEELRDAPHLEMHTRGG
ncbi:MAG: GTP 3',8-cyclase MoaA [Planctomycetota bacterium]